LKATTVVFSHDLCSTFTAMSSRTLLSDHVSDGRERKKKGWAYAKIVMVFLPQSGSVSRFSLVFPFPLLSTVYHARLSPLVSQVLIQQNWRWTGLCDDNQS